MRVGVAAPHTGALIFEDLHVIILLTQLLKLSCPDIHNTLHSEQRQLWKGDVMSRREADNSASSSLTLSNKNVIDIHVALQRVW
tara:strand:- start:297 stop:548 length:252 start_codon:yes stop_codon:yes gene_type:complete